MCKILTIAVIVISAMVCASAQTKLDRTGYADATGARLKADVPAAETQAFYPRTSYSYPADDFKPGVVRVGPRTTYLKEGLTTDEVVRLLGKPASISERSENGVVLTTYEFQRGEGRVIIAEFVAGVLVRYRTETSGESVVRADR
jgi:hypothetical protein